MSAITVMQVVDSLQVGGMETVAANLADSLSRRGVKSFLCSTRATGPLANRTGHGVQVIHLKRRGILGLGALKRMVQLIRGQQIDLLHVHGSALFFSVLARLFCPRVKVVWHAHSGRQATEERSAWLYRQATRHVAGVIAVNQPLAEWAKVRLRVPSGRVWYMPNFVSAPSETFPPTKLPGVRGKRIVCVANLRPEKDHFNLIQAMHQLAKSEPSASLLLVGSEANQAHASTIRAEIHQRGLAHHVFVLGIRADIPSILSACDIGVLSSSSEGMPLAVLEYGMAGLPTVATRVGQIPDVLDEGRAGILVTPGRPAELCVALRRLLQSEELRVRLGRGLSRRVQEKYGEAAFLDQLLGIYAVSLTTGSNPGKRSHADNQ